MPLLNAPNCGLMVDEKYIIGLDSICPICGRELFAELKKMIEK